MIRLSIPLRQALARLTMPVLVIGAFGLMFLGKADGLLAERARISLADVLVPIDSALSGPATALRRTLGGIAGLVDLAAENARLKREVADLSRWRAMALALADEDLRLRAELHYMPAPTPPFVTVPIVTDGGGVFARSALVALAPGVRTVPDAVALDADGLVGRVVSVGTRAALVLLITDINSRIPVRLGRSHDRALMVGTNGPDPRLIYWSQGNPPLEGERIETSGAGGVFPAGLPVGVVHIAGPREFEVVPAAHLGRLEIVRLFDYRDSGLLALRRLPPRPFAPPPRRTGL